MAEGAERKHFFEHYRNKELLIALAVSMVMLVAAAYINLYAGAYATRQASNPVTDIILSNIPLVDVDGLFVYGPPFFWIFIIIICLANPRKAPFALKSLSLFLVVRAIFICLTHIGPFPTQTVISTANLFDRFAAGNDLFFSAHTGMPFLMALVFWKTSWLRYICLLASVFFGAVVLLGHYHYSIDVFAAFFITYSIFHLAQLFFKKDLRLFNFANSQSSAAPSL